MKKIFIILIAAISVIAISACSGSKKSETSAQEPANNEPVETVVAPAEPEAPALSPAEMLKNFQDYAREYGEAFNNLSRNPRRFSELSGQSQKRVAEMEAIKDQLNARQQQDYQRAFDLIVRVNSGGR
jgi:hypothetical protein